MATVVRSRVRIGSGDRFFLVMALGMAGLVVLGFSVQLAAGRSSFSAPLFVHVHAVVFMVWVAIYVTQNVLGASRSLAWHRRLGWLAIGWVPLMLAAAFAVTINAARMGRMPFFFQPLHMLVFDPVDTLGFAALFAAAVAMRRRTSWHKRLHYCGMVMLMGAPIGRILPMPLLMPWAYHVAQGMTLLFVLAGIIADLRRKGRIHPAWWWGLGTMAAAELVTDLIVFSPLGVALYGFVTAGSPGAAIAPLEFGTFPPA